MSWSARVVSGSRLRAKHLFFLPFVLAVLLIASCSRDKRVSEKQTVRADTNFSSEIVLESYANTEVRGRSFLVLTWRAPYDRPRAAYWVFVHAIDKGGKILFQFDHPLLNAAGAPTILWEQEVVKDVFQVTPPAGIPAGKYNFRVGIYVPATGRFLEVFATNLPSLADEWRGKAVLLTDISCQ